MVAPQDQGLGMVHMDSKSCKNQVDKMNQFGTGDPLVVLVVKEKEGWVGEEQVLGSPVLQ